MSESASESGEPVRGRHRLRLTLACVLLALACVLTPVAVTAAWADDEVGDTDRFVATMAPLSSNPAVQAEVADRVAEGAVQAVDVAGLSDALRQALGLDPNNGSGPVSGSIQSLLSGVAEQAAHAFVTTDAFGVVWRDALRLAHASALSALEGKDDGAVSSSGGEVVLDLGPMVDRVRQSLAGQGLSIATNIPSTDRRFVLLHRDGLRKGQDAFRLLNTAGTWLPIVVVLLFVVGVCVAPRRRRVIMWAALGTLLALLLLAIALAVARRYYLDELPPQISRDAGAAIFDALVRFLRQTTRTLAVVAAAIAVAAFLVGPARPAPTIRRVLAVGPDAAGGTLARTGLGTGSVGRFVAERRGPIYAAVGLLGGIWLAWWNHPTVSSVLLVVLVVLAVLAVLEVVAAAGTGRPVEAGR
ncbi:hypothetical protein [Embleya scabrispora]|uniref:hypothetical protein n=1 Tax=Embleya scabrispora TaxID=159449 RepID=UPI0003A0AF40|nr:hypothetical protein [Embleya scabrispora]MYS85678.1 hypothetical protein [Streptomyces sp. SID5474]